MPNVTPTTIVLRLLPREAFKCSYSYSYTLGGGGGGGVEAPGDSGNQLAGGRGSL